VHSRHITGEVFCALMTYHHINPEEINNTESAIRVLLSQDRRTERFSSSTALHELEVYILRSLLCITHAHRWPCALL
jgi:hypothetical protein